MVLSPAGTLTRHSAVPAATLAWAWDCSSILAGSGGYAFKTAYDEAFARFSPGVMVEVDRIRALHDSPEVQWMDSFTDAGNVVLNRLWNERLKIQGLVFPTDKLGRLALGTLPMLRRAKRWLQH